MSDQRDERDELGGDEALAAEYVLGVLAPEERAALTARIDREQAFAALVDEWEIRLSPLGQAYLEAEPPAGVKAALDRRLFASTALEATAEGRGGFWQSLGFWRGLTAASLAALALAVGLPVLSPHPSAPGMLASLQPKSSDVQYVAFLDKDRHEVALSHVSGEKNAGRDFELWMIEGGNAPVSMGVLPAASTIRIELSREAQRRLAAGAVLAISLEPEGGSPTGQPTGPVVAAGDLRDI